MSTDLTIIRGHDESQLDDLRPLYQALHDHHTTISPSLAGLRPRTPEQAWSGRRHDYEAWLCNDRNFFLAARYTDTLVGYAFVALGGGYHGWASGDHVAEVKELVVSPDVRRAGVGTALMSRVVFELATDGITEVRLNAVVGNEEAVRFYERLGMKPATLTLLGRVVKGGDSPPHLESG